MFRPLLISLCLTSTALATTWTVDDDFIVLEPAEGWQACKTIGKGRMPEPMHLLQALETALNLNPCVSP